jgi:hypothetical protein
MRMVDVEGGFALVNKSPAQLAAEEKAAKRLSTPNTSEKGMPIPAHAFIAAEGGLRRAGDGRFRVRQERARRQPHALRRQGQGPDDRAATEKLQQEHGYLPAGPGTTRRTTSSARA